jgi:hypothetical protein
MTMSSPALRRFVRRFRCAAGTVIVALILSASAYAAAGDFSGANAYAQLQTLVRDIGPRPMGSPAEQRAMAFAVAKFREYGCDTAFVMPMTEAGGVNTKSGVAIGVARGRTGRIVVLGSHIDSAGPDIPGADDNGSGTACVIELARVLAPRDLQSTIVFCCFGGEEEGLRGSEHFVKTFPMLDSVALMIQLDMTDGASYLELDPDGELQVSAPRWLPRAAFDIYYNQLGFEGLVYPTHAATLNASMKGGTGSDHMPFLDKGIPAIDFTSDVNYPIHSPLDNLATFDSSGLARSGLLVQHLVERFDGGTPTRTTESYYLLQVGHWLLFVDYWMLWVLHVVSLSVATFAFLQLRRNRVRDRASRPRWSALKLFAGTLLVQLCIWFPDTILGILRGIRYPWVNNFGGYAVLALICGALGFWGVLRWLRRKGTTDDPYPYFLRASVVMVLLMVALLFANPEIALYASLALLFLSLAVLVHHPVVKGALALASLYLPLHMVFMEYLGLFQRSLTEGGPSGWWQQGVVDLGFALLLTVMAIPFVYGFAAVWRTGKGDLFWLRRFSTQRAWVVLVPLVVILSVALSMRPVYDARWQKAVRIEERYEMGADSSSLRIKGSEFLDGLRVSIAGRDTVLHGCVTTFEPTLGIGSAVRWLAVTTDEQIRKDSTVADSLRVVQRIVRLVGDRRPLLLELRYRSEKPLDVRSPWSFGARRSGDLKGVNGKTLTWYAFPDSIMDVPVTLTLKPGQKVIESLNATYTGLAEPVTAERPLTIITTRTVVSKVDTIAAAE